MNNQVRLLQRFKTNLINFFDALIEQLPKEKDLVFIRIMLDTVPMTEAIEVFSSRILTFREMVLKRDERFFIECNDLFEGLQKDKVNYFKTLWLSPQLTPDDKKVIWDWFRVFLAVALGWESMR